MKPDKLLKKINAFKESRIILTAFELEIFSCLYPEPKTLEQIVKEKNFDKRAAEILLNALCSIKILIKKENKYQNSKTAEKLLVKDKPDYLQNLFHTAGLWKKWNNLSEILVTGQPAEEKIPEEFNQKQTNDFISAMHRRAKIQAPKTAEIVNLKNTKTMLDIGGGSGIFSAAFIKKNQNITATVFDLPEVIKLTKKYIDSENLSHKIFTIAGNYNTDDFDKKYDLILLSAVIHINSFEQNKILIKKCAQALNKGGQIVISDYILNPDKTSPKIAALFAVNMLAATKNGNTYTQHEIIEMFNFADIKFDRRIDTDFGGTIITGIK